MPRLKECEKYAAGARDISTGESTCVVKSSLFYTEMNFYEFAVQFHVFLFLRHMSLVRGKNRGAQQKNRIWNRLVLKIYLLPHSMYIFCSKQ